MITASGDRPLVSVITVCRNAVATIDALLASVFEQSWPAIEFIVIDGASSDGTLAALERHRDRMTVLVSEPDAGIYDAMNKGIARATGAFLIFMNADDRFAGPHAIRDAMAAIERQPDGDVYYGSLHLSDIDHNHIPLPPEEAAETMVTGCLPHQATFARRAVFERTGLFDLRWRRHADYDWWLKILADPTIRLRQIDTVVASYALGGASSELAKGQPEVFLIQNASPVYRGADWDRRRIDIFQKAWLDARIEAANLRTQTGQSAQPQPLSWKLRIARHLPPPILRAAQRLKRRLLGPGG